MNLFGIRTLIFSQVITHAICLTVIALVWIQNRKHFAGLGLWLASFMIQTSAIFLITLGGIIPDFLSIVVSNSLIVTGGVLLYMGLERFVDSRTSQVHNYLLIAVFIFTCSFFTFINPSLPMRTITLSVGILLLCSQCAWLLLHRADPDLRPITRGTGYIFVALCLFATGSILVGLAVNPEDDFFQSDIFQLPVILINQLSIVILTFALTLMVNRRLILELECDILQRQQVEQAMKGNEEKRNQTLHVDPDGLPISKLKEEQLLKVNDGFSNLSKHPAYDFCAEPGRVLNRFYSGETLQLGNEAYVLPLVRDVTEYKRAEEHLCESERRYHRLLENMLGGYAYYKVIHESGRPRDFIYLQVNSAFEKLTGLNDVVGKRVSETFPATHTLIPKLLEIYGRTSTTGKPEQVEMYMDALDGWFSIYAYSPEPEQFVTILENVTEHKLYTQLQSELAERKRVEENLRESQENFQRYFNMSTVGMCVTSLDRHWIEANDRLRQMLGYSDEELAGLDWNKISHPDDLVEDSALYNQILANQRDSYKMDKRFIRKDGSTIFTTLFVTCHRNPDGTVRYLLAALIDITERKQGEESLLKLAAIEERQRLARDLHDSVNQSIHGLVLFSETMVSTLEKNNIARARQIADHLQESARQALKETRLMLYEMQSSGMERSIDLIQNLETRLATVERRAGVKAQIIQEGRITHCPRAWHQNLFWIAIEALNNALKHAQARNMQIKIRCSPTHLQLEIIDDGIGFDTDKQRVGGMGLQNMRARANLIGGQLEILSTPQKGSCVRFKTEIKAHHGQN